MHFGKCKLCHGHGHYKKKGTGWAKVPKEQQDRIREMLKDRRLSVKDIADAEGLSAVNFRRWINKGHVI
jgi:DNA invertase Pin-like site-specific DNA recombinase